jgi:hypothetical protein
MLREILQVLRSEYAFALFTASFAVLAAVIAFAIVGYLGLAILGILTLLICVTVEIGKDGPLGSINTPDLHAWDAQHREAMTRAERAEHRSEVGVLLRSLYFVRLIGEGLCRSRPAREVEHRAVHPRFDPRTGTPGLRRAQGAPRVRDPRGVRSPDRSLSGSGL